MIREMAFLALASLGACQPLYEGAGGAKITADCMQSLGELMAAPPPTNLRVSCVTIITSGATSNTPTSNASATVPVSGLP
jgi:hypothetical protein